MKSYLPFANLLDELKKYLTEKQTGTFFIASSDNTSARLGIEQGDIVFCCCRHFHGNEAVEALLEIKSGRFSFSKSLFPFKDKSKVKNQVALNILDICFTSDEVITDHKNEIDDDKKPEIHMSTYIYRGQVIEKVVEKKPKNSAKRKTSQRYYRGQPLND